MPRKSTNADLYRELHGQGKSCVEIAKAAGVSTSAVSQWLRSHGLGLVG